jgi:hypothetical protein
MEIEQSISVVAKQKKKKIIAALDQKARYENNKNYENYIVCVLVYFVISHVSID